MLLHNLSKANDSYYLSTHRPNCLDTQKETDIKINYMSKFWCCCHHFVCEQHFLTSHTWWWMKIILIELSLQVMTKTGEWIDSVEEIPAGMKTQYKSTMFPPTPEEAKNLHLDRWLLSFFFFSKLFFEVKLRHFIWQCTGRWYYLWWSGLIHKRPCQTMVTLRVSLQTF